MIAKASGIKTENALPNPVMKGAYFSLFAPSVWNAEAKPCHKWNARKRDFYFNGK